MKKGLLLFIFIASIFSVYSNAYGDSTPISIGTQKQLFIDDYIIDETDGVYQFLNQPVKYQGNPVLRLEPPPQIGGNELIVVYGNVIYDEDDHLFKMWYEASNYYEVSRVVAYATSLDGVNWELPCLRLVSYPNWHAPGCGTGEFDNNLVLDTGAGETAPGVFKDLHESDPQKRYKMQYFSKGNGSPLAPSFSPDGIHWSQPPDGNWIPSGDSSNPCMWDPRLGKYVAHTRYNADTPNGLERQVMQYESEDFVNWTKHGIIMKADENDPIGHRQFYEMIWMPYEDVYIGFLTVYHLLPERDKLAPLHLWEDRTDVQLTFSRDNRNWIRAGDRKTFLPNSTMPGDYDYGTIYVMNRPIIVGDEIWIYYTGISGLHWGASRGEIMEGVACLAKLRLDGFVSLDAPSKGTFTTKTITTTGDKLYINADARYGSIKVEILSADGNSIPGFSKDDCEHITGDNIRHEVKWNGTSDIKGLKSKTITLKFYMQRCKLYSFVFRKE